MGGLIQKEQAPVELVPARGACLTRVGLNCRELASVIAWLSELRLKRALACKPERKEILLYKTRQIDDGLVSNSPVNQS